MNAPTLTIALATLLLATSLPAAHASGDSGPCSCEGRSCLGVITVGSGHADDPLPTFYVDDRNFVFGNGIWIYEESNGQDGLQRGGSSSLVPDDPPACFDDSPHGPDTLVL